MAQIHMQSITKVQTIDMAIIKEGVEVVGGLGR